MNRLVFSLASGSSGNCLLAVAGQTRLLVDVGLSLRRLVAALSDCDISPQDLTAILITHEHSDHVLGLLPLVTRFGIPVYATHGTICALVGKYPDLSEKVCPFPSGSSFCVGEVDVETFATPHDSADSVGYMLHLGAVRAAIATDLGYMPDDVLRRIAGSEYILLESNHDIDMLQSGAYPPFLKKRILGTRGHLSNADSSRAAAFCARSGTRHILLGHLSRDNNRPEIALEAARTALQDEGVRIGDDLTLEVAPPHGRSLVFGDGA